MQIDFRQITEEGVLLEGESDGSFLDSPDESVRAATPLRHRLHASLVEGELYLNGWLEVGFDLRCDRCLETFRKTIRLDPYYLEEIIENLGPTDLTDRIRDDILLDLPGYPKCENADSPRNCPALAFIAPDSDFQPIQVPENGRAVWEALDDIKPESAETDEESESS